MREDMTYHWLDAVHFLWMFVGVWIGILIMCLCYIAAASDERAKRLRDENND